MTHIGTQTIKTARLTLRRFTSDDAQAMFDNWASDPAVTEFLTWQPHESVEESKRILESWITNYSQNYYYQCVIVPDDIGEPIDDIAVVGHNDDISMVHIGYALGKKVVAPGYHERGSFRRDKLFLHAEPRSTV